MNLKAVDEISQSDFKVNILLENDKYHETNEPKESKPITSKDVENDEVLKEEQLKEVCGDEKIGKDVDKGVSGKDGGKKFNREKQRQQITWVQFGTGFGGFGSENDERGSRFHYEPDRNDFIKYPLIIVAASLSINISYLLYEIFTDGLREPLLELDFFFLTIVSLIILLPLNYIMFYSDCVTRVPCNYICLALAFIGVSILSYACMYWYLTLVPLFVIISILTVVAVCLALSFTDFDFTSWYLYVIGAITALVATAIMLLVSKNIYNVYFKTKSLVLLPLFTVINAIVLILELQLVIGGGNIVMGENEVVYTAFLLYTCPIDVFLKIYEANFGSED